MKASKIEKISSKMGGSTLTKVARTHCIKHLLDTLRANGRGISDMAEIKAKDIQWYVGHQLQENITKRTLQNRMSCIRTFLREIERKQLANSKHLSCKTLGIDKASRNGTHQALSKAEYEQAIEQAKQRHAGFAACLVLQRELGLRAREVVQSVPSLQSWKHSLERGQVVRVIHGTKGGRPRDTGVVDQQKALEAVLTAINAVDKGTGRLIQSKSLQGAMRAFGRHCAAVKLTGKHSSHALRCTYTHERYSQHLENLGDRREALAATSQDLGHGDGRGTYVVQVYLANPAPSPQ